MSSPRPLVRSGWTRPEFVTDKGIGASLGSQMSDEKAPSEPPKAPGGILPPEGPAPSAAKPLTPEEQMALFEKELKENDWGHQPC